MTIDIAHDTQLVGINADARANVLAVRATEPNASELALWLEVSGVLDGSYVYDMYFQPKADAKPDAHHVYDDGEIAVVIPRTDSAKLLGATLRMSPENDGSMEITNPNKPAVPAAPPTNFDASSLETDIGKLVKAAIEEQVNPAIASHGGAAELVGVEGSTAYVRLSGGCQGCAMSRMTLTQGIETSILSAVPQITAVVDVTDHATGENPFYK